MTKYRDIESENARCILFLIKTIHTSKIENWNGLDLIKALPNPTHMLFPCMKSYGVLWNSEGNPSQKHIDHANA